MFLKLDRKKKVIIGEECSPEEGTKKTISTSKSIIIHCLKVEIENIIDKNGVRTAFVYAITDIKEPAICHSIHFGKKNDDADHNVYLMNDQGQTIERIW